MYYCTLYLQLLWYFNLSRATGVHHHTTKSRTHLKTTSKALHSGPGSPTIPKPFHISFLCWWFISHFVPVYSCGSSTDRWLISTDWNMVRALRGSPRLSHRKLRSDCSAWSICYPLTLILIYRILMTMTVLRWAMFTGVMRCSNIGWALFASVLRYTCGLLLLGRR